MAIRAILTLNGKEYEVLTFGQKFTQYARSSDNRSNGQVQFGHLEIGLESPEHNDVLELMLRAKYNPNVAGVLEVWTDGDMPLRRIKFSEGFIIHYKETFNLRSKEGMTTRFVIAAWQMEINKLPMQRPQMGYSWIKKPKEVKPLAEKAYVPPIPLVRKVKIERPSQNDSFVGDLITLVATQYNMGLSKEDKERIAWVYEIDGKQGKLTTADGTQAKGEQVSIILLREWMGKEVVFMPYLKKPIKSVSVKLKVEARPIVIFVNGYWNTGHTAGKHLGKISKKVGESIQKEILRNIGGKAKRHYWDVEFIRKTREYITKKHQEEFGITPKEIAELYYDGADIWSSSGELRYVKGIAYTATKQFRREIEEKKIISSLGKPLNSVYIVSHSMGAAYAEGVVTGLLTAGVNVSCVLHFSPADNKDFKVSLPSRTYQINLLPDIVLMYKKFDDVVGGIPMQFFNSIKSVWEEQQEISPNLYQIKGLLNSHFKVEFELDKLNHYYTKSGRVWQLIKI